MCLFIDLVVRATLRRCAHSIHSDLDGEHIASRLNQENILPLAAVPYVHRILPPDNPGRQATNIMLWLQRATREEFEQFIAIVKEMGQRSRPLEDLGQKLEEEYVKLRDNPGGPYYGIERN